MVIRNNLQFVLVDLNSFLSVNTYGNVTIYECRYGNAYTLVKKKTTKFLLSKSTKCTFPSVDSIFGSHFERVGNRFASSKSQ